MRDLTRYAITLFVILLVGGTAWAGAAPLALSDGSSAAMHNSEGIKHYEEGHWKEAHKHFKEAVQANPEAAEAHYNLALALDKMGQHMDAAKHFKHAQEKGQNNPDIQNSKILQAHLKMLK